MMQYRLRQLGQPPVLDESLYAPLLALSFSFPEELTDHIARFFHTLETPLETLEDALTQDPAE